MTDDHARAWLDALTAAFRREDATMARVLVDWHGRHPDGPPPLRSTTEPIAATPAANE